MLFNVLFKLGGASFNQKELSTKKLCKKSYPEKLSNKNIIQINPTLYQRNDAMALFIKK